jgi:transglycosylase-like protein with SLT domain
MRREHSHRMASRFRAGGALGLAVCTMVGALLAGNRAVAQASRPPSAQTPVPRLEQGRAATLDRVAYAVEGAESDHGADPHMWGPDSGGPQGPMQVSAAAAADVGGGDRFDDRDNRALGRAYLAQLYRRYGSWPDAVAAYNWGPGNMDSWISSGRRFDKFPLAVEIYRIRVLVGSSLATGRLFVHRQPRRPAADPHNGRAAVARLYTEIMRTSELAAR